MSELNGSLADFTIPAVVRLLSSGAKTGILVVKGETLDGSIFFDDGDVSYATTRRANADDTPEELDRRTEGTTPVAADAMIADVIARLSRIAEGSFNFQTGIQPVHDVTDTFDVEELLGMVDDRMAQWSEVITAIGSTELPYTMADSLDVEDEIALTGLQWNLLAALGDGASVSKLSMLLRLPELETAEMMVELKQDGLVEEGRSLRAYARAVDNGGARLVEPDPTEVVVTITDAAAASEVEVDSREEPVSQLAERWRNLRTTGRDEVPSSG